MPERPVIVLKFGGSVLRTDADFELAAREVQRWRTDGFAVVAVVSARAGRTDGLLQECRGAVLPWSTHAIAAHVAMGERESAAQLCGQFQPLGVSARTVDAALLKLVARGDALDADPQDVDVAALRPLLQGGAVAVVPGFAAIDESGRPVLLGRGGSDLTALFLAQRLGARCRLLKDVGGLHGGDPAHGDGGGRVATATWDELLAAGGRLVQPKAVRLAQQHGLCFEVGALGGTVATQVGGVTERTPEGQRGPRRG